MSPQFSIAVVGVRYPNKKIGNRQFEIAMCSPGESVRLEKEPDNPADENAIAVFSCRDVQIGYVSADRTPLIHKAWRQKRDVAAVFQGAADHGAWIRVAFDGEAPALPVQPSASRHTHGAGSESDFWPDEVWPDE